MFSDNRGLHFSVRQLRLAHFFVLYDKGFESGENMKRFVNVLVAVLMVVMFFRLVGLKQSYDADVEAAWQEGLRMSMSETGELVEMVYISPRGEKYHRDRQCPQGNGMRIAITEVEGKYGPCKKCMSE